MASYSTSARETDPLFIDSEKAADNAHDSSRYENDDGDSLLDDDEHPAPLARRLWDVVRTYWHLGLIAFGGPSAHVGILRDHLCVQRDWIDSDSFTELFALGQGLPGPSSTQLLISTATTRGGPLGGMIAFVFWSAPGFVVQVCAATALKAYIDPDDPPIWLLGIPPAAMALVFKAFYGFCTGLDKFGLGIGLVSCVVSVMIAGDTVIPRDASQFVYPALLVLGGMTTFVDSKLGSKYQLGTYDKPAEDLSAKEIEAERREQRKLAARIGIPLWAGVVVFLLWLIIFIASTTLVHRYGYESTYLVIFETFYRIGSIIFGGGPVVLPMLENEVVPGWMDDATFFQGLGLAQSLPGPLFNFSAFLGATYAGLPGAFVAHAGLFGPGFILIFAMIPFWVKLRSSGWFKAVLRGVNAAAIGIIGSACVFLYEKAVRKAADAMVFIIAGGLTAVYGVQAPLVIAAGAICGALFSEEVFNRGQAGYCDA